MPSSNHRRPHWSSDLTSTHSSRPRRPSTPYPSLGTLNPPSFAPSHSTSQLYDFIRYPYLRDSEEFYRSSPRYTTPPVTETTRYSPAHYYSPTQSQEPPYYESRTRSISRDRDHHHEYRSPTPHTYHHLDSRRDPISSHVGSTYQPSTYPASTAYTPYESLNDNPTTGSHTYGITPSALYDRPSTLYDRPSTPYDRPSGSASHNTFSGFAYPREEPSRRRSPSPPRRYVGKPQVIWRDDAGRERPFYGELRYEIGGTEYPEGAWLYDPGSLRNRGF